MSIYFFIFRVDLPIVLNSRYCMEELTLLDKAIDGRIERERAFIDKLAFEFDAVRKKMERVAAASPELEGRLRPIVDALNQATTKLKTLSPLPEDVDMDKLVQVTSAEQTPVEPHEIIEHYTRDPKKLLPNDKDFASANFDNGRSILLGGRICPIRRRSRRPRLRTNRSTRR